MTHFKLNDKLIGWVYVEDVIHYTSLSMASRVCQLCIDLVGAKRATNLFGAVGMQNNWGLRITVLQVAITNNLTLR